MRQRLAQLAVATAALTLPVTQANEFTSRPLKSFAVCDNIIDFVTIEGGDGFLPTDAIARIQRAVRTKMTAYRMLTPVAACTSKPRQSYVSIAIVLTKPVSYEYRGFSVKTAVFALNQGNISGAIDLWNITSAGVSRVEGEEFVEYLTNAIQGHVDELAADYAIANP